MYIRLHNKTKLIDNNPLRTINHYAYIYGGDVLSLASVLTTIHCSCWPKAG